MKIADVSDGILAASSRIDPEFRDTPQFKADALSERLGKSPLLKIETVNPIRSFKGRGASLLIDAAEPGTQLICASVGNFGQGMAYAARARQVPLTVFLAGNANPLKVERVKSFGAQIVQTGNDFDAAKLAAKSFAQSNGYSFIEDGAAPEVTIGAGTIGLEMLAGNHRFSTILVPVGNGALLNGVASWIKSQDRGIRVVGVCSQGAPAMAMSWREGRSISTPDVSTIADGIAVREPVPEAVTLMQGLADDILLVSDAAIIEAVQLCFDKLGLLVEPAGAAGLATLIEHPESFPEDDVATILCGGNIAPQHLKAWISGRRVS
ncbi:threonine/serine dehydratase [Sphingorhabdus sp. EL138]|uniref:threonine ammonia-lyase n=1 Tax=Sphingorhabdus sp. EL138 TaxID=2073156 RepID=UPI000D694138|nr:threonine/serine dehydratase [Sphingorhabdus sp. EL138]